MVDAMNDEKLKEYLHDTPQEFKIIKIKKCNPKRKVRLLLFLFSFRPFFCLN